jgi:preprotein translocase subunit SecE
MARHRQRARERKLQQPIRENIPSELEHASGDVDEVEARIISGAGGEPGGLDSEAADKPYDADGVFEDELEDDDEYGDEGLTLRGRRRAAARRTGPRPEGNAVINFLRASWAELQRVQWPDRRQVAQATAVVLGFVIIAGVYLGLADAIAKRIVDAII